MKMFVSLALNSAVPGPATVILLGLGIVFLGLICIILLVTLMGAILRGTAKEQKDNTQAAVTKQQEQAVIPNRPEFVAAVSAAIAEELGTDISKIRIVSIRRL